MVGIAPSNQPFHRFYMNNGIVAEGVTELVIESVRMRDVANFPVIVSHSQNVRIHRVYLTDCGSLNAKGRNNTSGGILLEEGTKNFEVTNCKLLRVRGNGIWTHSLYTSPRNEDGRIAENDIQYIGTRRHPGRPCDACPRAEQYRQVHRFPFD